MALLDDLLKRNDATSPPKGRTARASTERERVMARDLKMRYDAVAGGRRTEHWRQSTSFLDPNAEIAVANENLRAIARDMVRNNAYAARAKSVIGNNIVGAGIIPAIQGPIRLTKTIMEHFDTTAIDADGLHNLYGLQSVVMKAVVESGEVLVRRRPRFRQDGLPLPFQIQILESDHLDSTKNITLDNGGRIVNGIELDAIGRRVAYWLFPTHPGAQISGKFGFEESQRIEAKHIAHIYRMDRPGQMRGVSWFAPVILRLRDYADFVDAQLVRQKIAACFAAFVTTDSGVSLEDGDPYPLESFEPGMIERLRDGESVSFAQPPTTSDFQQYSSATIHEIAVGLGVTYESLAGDLSQVNYSSARMGWLEFQRNVDAWRWLMLIPQFLDVLTRWTGEAVELSGGGSRLKISWTPPKRELINPKEELQSAREAIRSGLSSRSEEIRKLGFDPEAVEQEIAADNQRADQLELIFDSDARYTNVSGGLQGDAMPAPVAAPAVKSTPAKKAQPK